MTDYPISAERAKIYSYRKFFSPLQASAIMLGYDPICLENSAFTHSEQGETVKLLKDTLDELAFNGFFKDYKTDVYFNFNEEVEYIASISANNLKEWALSNDYQWLNEIPPIIGTDTKKDERIAELETALSQALAEIEQLKQPIDYSELSIYGHSTEAIKAIFGVINRFWKNADLTQPDTIANKEHIEQWIYEKFPSLSETIRQAIQKITRPEQARYIGRKS